MNVYEGKFTKALPNVIGVEIDPENTYVQTLGQSGLTYGLKVSTPYACRVLDAETIGDAFSYLSEIARVNRKEQENQD